MNNIINFPVANVFVHEQPVNDFSAAKRRAIECGKLHRQLTDVFIEAIEFCGMKELNEVSAAHDFAIRSHDPVVVKAAIAKMQLLIAPVAVPQERVMVNRRFA